MASEIFIFARFHASPGNEDTVKEALLNIIEPTSEEDGCLDIRAFRSIHDPRLFFIHSHWRDEAAFDNHTTKLHTLQFVATIEPLIDHALDVSRTQQIN